MSHNIKLFVLTLFITTPAYPTFFNTTTVKNNTHQTLIVSISWSGQNFWFGVLPAGKTVQSKSDCSLDHIFVHLEGDYNNSIYQDFSHEGEWVFTVNKNGESLCMTIGV